MTLPAMPIQAVQSVQRTLVAAATATTSPFTLQQQVQDWGGRYWSYSFDMRITQGDDGRRLSAFFARLGGKSGRFLWREQSAFRRGVHMLGMPVVDGAGQSGTTLQTAGWTPQTQVMSAGDLFSVGQGVETRLYQIVEDAESNAQGEAELEFVPRLRMPPADNAYIEIAAPAVLLRLTSPVPADIRPAQIYRFSVSAREAT